MNFFLCFLYASLCKVGKSWSSWSQVDDLPTCPLREFMWFMRKNDCKRVQNATCQRALKAVPTYRDTVNIFFIDNLNLCSKRHQAKPLSTKICIRRGRIFDVVKLLLKLQYFCVKIIIHGRLDVS